ncbi:Anaphase-promoting complex subunit 1 [Senna tora]|uniref:Anaphase-promoting complex subunit 1 n=1 Tax=Senna tora TaxID=362788 RepID=A0A834T7A8_9FABA|nr:Anaphase-promoting complex subunit 1 [Senna tora]
MQTVDVDTGLPVHVTIRETEHYAESSFSEVTPCLLPERSILKRISVCGPRYWPQVIDFVPEDKPWWNFGDKNNPFNSGVLYIKRKVGACSYVDDPIGCQSLLSQAMHKVFGLTNLKASDPTTDSHSEPGSVTVDQLVSTFSSDPSLIAFAQLSCELSCYNRSVVDFQEFCLQVLFECVSKDRPALLQCLLLSAQSKLNELVFVKYNRSLRRRFNERDSIDPISLKDIDDSNEWLLGKVEEELDDNVFEDDDLTWQDVAIASGAEEPLCYSRKRSSTQAPTLRMAKKAALASSSSTLRDLDEEEANSEETEEEEEIEGLEENNICEVTLIDD